MENTILSKVFHILSICFLYVIGLLQGLLAKISTSHKMSDDSNDVSIRDYLRHIKKSKDYLQYIISNYENYSLGFNPDKKFFKVQTIKKIENKIKNKIRDETENCPLCKHGDIRNPDGYESCYGEYSQCYPNFTESLNCLICSTFTEDIRKSKIYRLDIDNSSSFEQPFDYENNRIFNKLIIISCCSICGEYISNSFNNKIICKNKDHKKERFKNNHDNIIIFLKKNILYLLELKRLYHLNWSRFSIRYRTDEETIMVLFFHLKTDLFFIYNSHLIELVARYIFDEIPFDHFVRITEDLNYYFSDKYFIEDIYL